MEEDLHCAAIPVTGSPMLYNNKPGVSKGMNSIPVFSAPVPASRFLPCIPALALVNDGLQPINQIHPFLPELVLVSVLSAQ